MDINDLKSFLRELGEKKIRSEDDLLQLHNALAAAGLKKLECGHIKENTLFALQNFAQQNPEDKRLAGKLWDDISAGIFVTAKTATPPRTPRPF